MADDGKQQHVHSEVVERAYNDMRRAEAAAKEATAKYEAAMEMDDVERLIRLEKLMNDKNAAYARAQEAYNHALELKKEQLALERVNAQRGK